MSLIRVTGCSSIHVVPDVTRIGITVSGVFKAYNEAYQKAREASSWMVKILEYNNLSEKMCKTVRMDISGHTLSDYSKTGSYIGSHKDGYDHDMKMKVDIGMDPTMTNNLVRGIGKFIENTKINIGYTIQNPLPTQLKMLKSTI